jgi:hypothetical protein
MPRESSWDVGQMWAAIHDRKDRVRIDYISVRVVVSAFTGVVVGGAIMRLFGNH